MEYDQIIMNFSKIINDNFNMQILRELRNIYTALKRAYRYEKLKVNSNKNLCAIIYEKYLTYINDSVMLKLKEISDFNDKILNKIIYYISSVDKIDDIYILGQDVIAKYNINDFYQNYSSVPQYVSLESNYMDISSKAFAKESSNFYIRLVAMSINNVVKPLINNYESDEILIANGDSISYRVPDLKIYCNHDLTDILSDESGEKITKVLVTYRDKMFNLDMKLRYDYVILCYKDCEIKSLSEILNTKEKQKRK